MTDRRDRPGRGLPARRHDLVVSTDQPDGRLSRRQQGSDLRRTGGFDDPEGRVPADPDEGRPLRGRRAPVADESERQDPLVGAQPVNLRRRSGRRGEFHPGVLTIDDAPGSPVRRQVVLAVAGLLLAVLAWSYFGRLASYTSAAGKIQVVDRTKVVEALARGKVIELKVQDGDVVEAGAAVVQLDPADALAARTIVQQKLTDLRAEILRLKTTSVAARADTVDPATTIAWGGDVPAPVREREDGVAHADLARLASQIATLLSQKRAKEVTRQKYQNSIEAQKALVAVTQENAAMIQGLVQGGYNSQAKYLEMKALLDDQQVTQTSYEGSLESARQAILMIDSEIAKTRETFVTAATQKMSSDEQAVVDLAQQLVKAEQTLANMTLRAPTAGIVHANQVTAIDQVVKPGEQLMQVVPRDAPLEIQAYLSNQDIGFVRIGDPATIKITAFTYGTYGSIDGTVTDVAKDALVLPGKLAVQPSSLDGDYRATTDAQKTSTFQFPIIVRAARSTMTVEGKEIPLVSGMNVTVEILTEHRRAIDFIISPLLELFSTAGHERS